jgi:TolA-binding protein
MRFLFVIALLVLTTPALAQGAPDPAFMQRAIAALQNQRNAALDAQTVAEAKLQGLTEDLNKANARIKELEDAKKAPEKK